MHILSLHEQNHFKLVECFMTIRDLSDMTVKSSMWKLYMNCKRKWTELDNEFITCRKLRKITAAYTQIEAEYNDCITTFEQWHVIAVLSHR